MPSAVDRLHRWPRGAAPRRARPAPPRSPGGACPQVGADDVGPLDEHHAHARGPAPSPASSRRRVTISAATSMPVKPAPTTTAVSRPGPSGAAPRPWRCASSAIASSKVSALHPCSASPGTSGRWSWLPAASKSRSYDSDRVPPPASATRTDAPADIDARRRGVHELHADGPEHARERHAHVRAGMGLVQARSDGQVRVTRDEAQPDVGGAAGVVELPHRRHGSPEPGESPSDDHDVLHDRAVLLSGLALHRIDETARADVTRSRTLRPGRVLDSDRRTGHPPSEHHRA